MKKTTFYRTQAADGFCETTGYLFTYGGRDYALGKTRYGNWDITDVKSGFLITTLAFRTRKEAVEYAPKVLDKVKAGFFDSGEYLEKCKRLDDYIKTRGEGGKAKSNDEGANMSNRKARNGFKYFNVDHTTPIEAIKRQYRALSLENHPDMGGDEAAMKAINAEYERLKATHYNIHENAKGEVYTDERQDAPDDITEMFVDIIDALIHVLKVNPADIEVCGKFLWLHNTNKANKHHYKALRFKWSANKKAWYRAPEGYKCFKHRAWDMDEIRAAYGSYKVNRDDDDKPKTPKGKKRLPKAA